MSMEILRVKNLRNMLNNQTFKQIFVSIDDMDRIENKKRIEENKTKLKTLAMTG